MALLGSTLTLSRQFKCSDEEFRKLADFIYRLLGIRIDERRRYLVENRLSPRLNALGLKGFAEYQEYLRFGAERRSEIDRFTEAITTNETSLFRDTVQLDIFRDKVLGPLLAAKLKAGRRNLRIWSAGCSSGEEPYTLAILVAELLRANLAQWDVRIFGSDISLAVLELAKAARYGTYAVRTTPPALLQRWFTQEDGLAAVRPELRRLVQFERINLNDPLAMKRVQRSDVIFCRNVIIYFDDDMRKRVVAAFYDNLLPGGHLVLGHSETLKGITATMLPVPGIGSPIYRKASER
ncbi:MAG: protein-glutamate O-methyltransferase CheR [Desulfovibrionaceae bacterium]